jgi:hypothetical protein
VPVEQQLARVTLGRRRHPDPRKAILGQQFHEQFRIPPIGLLFSFATGANLGRIPDPHLVPQFVEQPLEPLRLPTGFDPYAHRPR